MSKKYIIGILLLLFISYLTYEIYLYKLNDSNLILFVNNRSLEHPSVKIEIFINNELVVNDIFNQNYKYYNGTYYLKSNLGIKKIVIKVDGKIKLEKHFCLFGVKWIVINNKKNNIIVLSYYLLEPMFL